MGEAFRSYLLRCILALLCALCLLPQRNAFTAYRPLLHTSKTTSIVSSCSVTDFKGSSSGFARCYGIHHGLRFMSTSPDDTEENSEDTAPSASSSVGWKDLTPTERILATEKMDPATRVVVEAAEKRRLDPEEPKYPIDLPSPILLSSSMILAIASAGCLFELLGGGNSESMVVGFGPTLAIALIGTPLSVFLLYAAIAKATAETEADDQAFLSGK